MSNDIQRNGVFTDSTDNAADADRQQVEGIDELIGKTRLKKIISIRDDIHKIREAVRLEMNDHRLRDQYGNRQNIVIYRTLVDSYVMELEPLLRKYKRGQQMLNETNYGTIRLAPKTRINNRRKEVHIPGEGWLKLDKKATRATANGESVVSEKRIELQGLRSLFNLDDKLTQTLSLPISHRAPGVVDIKEHTISGYIGQKNLDNMVRDMNWFLAEIGLELQPKANTEDGKIDYSDLLDDG